MTAAHCVENFSPDELLVLTELNSEDGYPIEEKTIESKFLFPHPAFSGPWRPDIGLIKLVKDPGKEVELIRLISPGEDRAYINSRREASIIATGSSVWGDKSFQLKKMKTRFTQNRLYSSQWSWIKMPHKVGSIHFAPHNFYVCGGDSGGPVFGEDSAGKFLIAVIYSSTDQCDDPDWSEVRMLVLYIRIQSSAAWLLHTIDAHSKRPQLEKTMDEYMTFPVISSGNSPWDE